MTSLRPEHDPYGVPPARGREYEYGYEPQRAYGVQDGLDAAVDGLRDPLSDPLPDVQQPTWVPEATGVHDPYTGQQGAVQAQQYQGASGANDPYPGRRAAVQPQQYQEPSPYRQYPEPSRHQEPQEWYDPEGYRRDWYGQQQAPQAYAPDRQAPQAYAPDRQAPQAYAPDQQTPQAYAPDRQTYGQRPEPHHEAPGAPLDSATMALQVVSPQAVPPRAPAGQPASPPARVRQRIAEQGPRSAPAGEQTDASAPGAGAPDGGGRAQRRRAAQGASAPGKQESPGVVVSRLIGELFITFGVVMLLFVTYQLWWTNVRAGMHADGAAHSLQNDWAKGGGKPRAAGAFEPGQGFAIMHIPKLDVKVPVAEGIDKHKVLDRGMVGHYAEGQLKTAMPSDKQGNFAVAGHRNTHGEPFRYVNRLVKGDKIVVETQDVFYTYEMTSMLPQTSPSNVGVIQPVPPGSGFSKPGRYLTLTTCTPEFTSTYRLIVWGKMVEERPRSKGMPAALGG
ncbi:class E sortase [Streptomyces sp. CA-294286]|uniref:class E sortase n=1 Tax=Streptomyces sp. CA-294286 TaxID=3240070 RepID=UPI003D8DAD56